MLNNADVTKITSTIHVRVPEPVHHLARVRAVEQRLTLKEYIAALILKDVSHQKSAVAHESKGEGNDA